MNTSARSAYRRQVDDAVDALRRESDAAPPVAVVAEASVSSVLGNGAGTTRLPLQPESDADASGGEVVRLGALDGGPRIAQVRARRLCDGFTAKEAAFPVRVLAAWGVQAFVLVGTAAGLDESRPPVGVMLVSDHLNLQGDNPLTGGNEDDWGPRFPDMTAPYDSAWRAAVRAQQEDGEETREGVYAALPDAGAPSPAEQAMLRRAGADAAGAGLLPDVLAARHMNRRVLAAVVVGKTDPVTPGAEVRETLSVLVDTAVQQAGASEAA
jgi:purine-nucleoside phosphorylase